MISKVQHPSQVATQEPTRRAPADKYHLGEMNRVGWFQGETSACV